MSYQDNGNVYCGNTSLGQFAVGIPLHREVGGDITITGVSSSRADGVEIIDVIVVDTPDLGVGTTSWPIEEKWHGERKAVGAVVPPHKRVDLVVGVRTEQAADGSLGTISIEYTEGGREFVTDTYSTIEMKRQC